MSENQDNSQKNIQLKMDPSMEQGTYSNAVSIHINQNEVVLDFGYLIPNQQPTTVKLVSRLNLTHASAESLLNLLSNSMLDWRNKSKESKNK